MSYLLAGEHFTQEAPVPLKGRMPQGHEHQHTKDVDMTISEQLRDAIKDYGSVYVVARVSGISQSALNRFATGERGLQLDTAERLAAFLGMRLTRPTTKQGE